ncbi:hypothetical protein PUR57_18070 [Streptomyces sp. JV176]|uniref:helix-turn-helix domain-containing protein n=1 Tax=Streptomyces sp. JV176 TaxID=858630 RepID=UPI002E784316|nr:hypothetical protein [Streptomyces sp. JV176]MEE1800555.1 hypothetical protein [Streptomyces sp. JV176]
MTFDSADRDRRSHLTAIIIDLDVQLARRDLSVGEFAAAVGSAPANIAVPKNGRAKARSRPVLVLTPRHFAQFTAG